MIGSGWRSLVVVSNGQRQIDALVNWLPKRDIARNQKLALWRAACNLLIRDMVR